MDYSGEMEGHIRLDGSGGDINHKTTGGSQKYQSKTNICIMKATVQSSDKGGRVSNKLMITECFDTDTRLTFDQEYDLGSEKVASLNEEHDKMILRCAVAKSTINNHGLIKALELRNSINTMTDFIYTGQ